MCINFVKQIQNSWTHKHVYDDPVWFFVSMLMSFSLEGIKVTEFTCTEFCGKSFWIVWQKWPLWGMYDKVVCDKCYSLIPQGLLWWWTPLPLWTGGLLLSWRRKMRCTVRGKRWHIVARNKEKTCFSFPFSFLTALRTGHLSSSLQIQQKSFDKGILLI